MIAQYFLRLFRRVSAFKKIVLTHDNALAVIHSRVDLRFGKGSQVILNNGQFRIGYSLPGTVSYAAFPNTVIQLDEGAQIICDGPVIIAPGATIRVGKGATLRFGGENNIAHNLTLLCRKEIQIGEGASISWSVTLIDDDGHRFSDLEGNGLRKFPKPLIIGKYTGIQMGVMIPSGVSIGSRAVIAAGTVLRQDVPAECTAFTEAGLKIKSGWMAPGVATANALEKAVDA